MESPFIFSSTVQPTQFLNGQNIPDQGTTYSWGYVTIQVRTAVTLRKKTINLLSVEVCKNETDNVGVQDFNNITQICGEPSFLCGNDHGSPMFADIQGTSLQIGFASHPTYCDAGRDAPQNAIYIKITADLLSWASVIDNLSTK